MMQAPAPKLVAACAALSDDVYNVFDGRPAPANSVALAENGARALCVATSEYLIVAYQGTDVADGELWNNFRVWPKPAPCGGLAVAGYLEYALAVWPAIRGWIEQQADLPIYVTGHSRGGAAAACATHLWPFTAAITFGAPKAGNAAFWDACQCPVFRVTTANDFAPEYPSLFGIRVPGWTQGGQELRLGPSGLTPVEYRPLANRGRQDLREHDSAKYRQWAQLLSPHPQ